MAGETPARQDDIEELLRQAQMAAGLAPEIAPAPASPPAPPSPAQDEPTAEAAQRAAARPVAATATATMPPLSTPIGPPPGGPVGDDIQYLLAQAEQALASVDQPADPALEKLTPFEFKDLAASPPSGEKATLELLRDVDLNLRIELGRTQMYLEDVLKLKRGSVVTLDKLAGDPVDVFVNGRIVARGEVLVLNDNFCVRVTELLAGNDFD
ncbi:MAG TPA: flagellar motor switch protein FliN [Pirellulaceae bacterium]|nr:flagellar motor switch protein FliN [Pirellulaceae bacterium]